MESVDKCDLNELVDKLLRQLNVFRSGGSCWVLKKFLSLDITVCRTKSLCRTKFSVYTCKHGRHKPLYNGIRFLDSLQYMSQSPENFAKTMETSSLHLLRNKFSGMNDFNFGKIRGRDFFPYNYFDRFEKISQPSLASGDAWSNSLPGKIDISERD